MDGALFLDEVVHDHMTEATRLLQPVRTACGPDSLVCRRLTDALANARPDELHAALELIARLPAPLRARIEAEAAG